MDLFKEAIKGIDKQIKDLESAIRDLKSERQELIKKSGIDTGHPLRELIRMFSRVAKLRPPTDEQCQTLYDLYGEDIIVCKMGEMENWKGITKKVYFYATISNWLRRDVQRAIPTGQRMPNQSKEYWDKFKKNAAQAETEKGKWKSGDLTSELRKK